MKVDDANKVAAAVSPERQWTLLMDLAKIGGVGEGGVDRQALTEGDTTAKNFVVDWAKARGMTAHQDEAANLFLRLEGREPALAPIVIGSHLDSQPSGGRFDGAYGVVAGLEVIAAIRQAALAPLRPIEVVSWMNEEGARFSPGASGSSAFAGTRDPQTWLGAIAADGARIADDLARSRAKTRASHRPMAAMRPSGYLEAHIEQGPVLEHEGCPACAVDAVQGMRRFTVAIEGRTAHAGTTPRGMRRDALAAATRAMTALHAFAEGADDALRLTIGRLDVQPNAVNTVPGLVRFSIDLRHPCEAALDVAEAAIARCVGGVAAPCTAAVERVSAAPPVRFDDGLVAMLEAAAVRHGLPALRLSSGAGHDAMHLARLCPSAMVFVRCRGGVSHHEDEFASADDLACGTRILADAAWRLAERI